MKVVRTYKLLLNPNRDKKETVYYCINRFNRYVNLWLGKLYFNGNKSISTHGLGTLCNQSQYKARNIVKALRMAEKETKSKTNVPIVKNCGIPIKYEISKNSKFDYWVKVSNLFTKHGIVELPAKSHKKLNQALKEGWKRTNYGEVKLINGNLYLYIFIEKEVNKAYPKEKTIGVDVGINKSISTSYKHKGTELSSVIKRLNSSQAERKRQQKKFNQVFRKKDKKSYLKQILDKEAKGVIARCLTEEASLAIESRKVISNLKSGRLHGWARCYFANRIEVLCKENEIFLVEVNPAYSSKTCHVCNTLGDRNKQEFKCLDPSCSEFGRIVDSDVQAAKVIRNRGRQVILEKILPKWQSVCRK